MAQALNGSTTLRFAPGATVIARGPASLQFGADATRSGIVETPAAPRLVPVLRALHTPTRLDRLIERAAADCGMTAEETTGLVADLVAYRVLLTDATPTALIIGRGPLAAALRPLLAAAGVRVRSPLHNEGPERFLAGSDDAAPLIVVDDLTTTAHLAHLTRNRGGAVLPVTLVDARVFAGPLSLGRGGPCLHCAHLYHLERDANWPAVLRLIRDARPLPDPLVVSAGAAAVARLARRLSGAPDPPGVSADYPARGTRVVVDPFGPVPWAAETLRPHPRCPVCY
ncbi:hypothetical protein [Corynebacterium senegalense]|uniref:hypothetical protein n=1 Tax=Corynebacterium senegalense TaxID=2080750 RepID=UPI000E205CAB|nr:hypothetical protein [Corynebacterium senegalense]